MTVNVLGVCGSLRRASFNRQLLRVAATELPQGARLEVFDGLAEIPPYNDDSPASRSVGRFRDAIAATDAVLIATPEYNSSVPGQLKNALDWASRPFPHNALRGKATAVIGVSTGLFGAVWAQAELRKVLAAIGANVVDAELPVGQAHAAFLDDGGLVDPDLRSRLADILGELVNAAASDSASERPNLVEHPG